MNRHEIARRIPHSGSMCLLDELIAWDATGLRCRASSHRDPAHPLRLDGTLPSPTAIEYASQAMALHGSLNAAPGTPPVPGFLAAVRGVTLHVPRLDDVESDLTVDARLQAGDSHQALYHFSVSDAAGRVLVDGRATVILNSLP
jgi:predicted hotdog family 3-hydroxylacyl-ACP dehydratase